MRKIGLVSISFRPLSAEEIIKKTKEAGLSLIEWGSDVHALPHDMAKLSEIKTATEKAGLHVSSYGSYFRVGVTPPAEADAYILAAKALGTNIIRVWAGDRSYSEYTEEERAAFRDKCKKLAESGEKHGVSVAFECHNRTYTDCVQGALDLMEHTSSPNLRMYWQPNQFRTTEENIAYAKAVAPYTVMIHTFAWEGERRYPLICHDGIWKTYFSCFPENIPALLEFMPDDDVKSLASEAASLRKILNND